MKKLFYLLFFIPFLANAQVNGTIQKTASSGTVRGSFGSLGLDTIPRVTGVLTNGYVLMFNSSLNKWYAVNPATFTPSLGTSPISLGGTANGLSYLSGNYRLHKVTATTGGVLTTGMDTIVGVKTLIGNGTNPTLIINSVAGGPGTNDGQMLYSRGGVAKWNIGLKNGSPNNFEIARSGNTNSISINETTGAVTLIDGSILGTPASGVVTNLTGTASININGTVGATTPTTGAFTSLSASSLTNGSVYSSSGTLTNTAPTSGTIGYWSRSGTTLTTATGTDAVTLGGGLNIGGSGFTYTGNNGFTSAAFVDGGSADQGTFRLYAGGVEKINISADGSSSSYIDAGNFGIGNATPSYKLDVNGTGNFSGALTGTSATWSGATTINTGSGVQLTTNATSGRFTQTSWQNAGVQKGAIYWDNTNNLFYYDSVTGHVFNQALTGTSATFSGLITSTNSGQLFYRTGASTTAQYFDIGNTGGRLFFGVDNSAGSAYGTGGVAYATALSAVGATSLQFFTNSVARYTIDASGNNTWTGNGAFTGTISASNLTSGTYTPTLTNVTNVSAATVASPFNYIRVGNTVFVYGYMTFTTTSTGDTFIGVSLPVASNFGSNTQAIGTGTIGVNGSIQSLSILADTTNDRAQVGFNTISSGSNSLIFSFSYQII